jgi:hypothetical protein
MVDSIRQTAHIGGIKPSNRLRPLERRHHPRRDPRDSNDPESQEEQDAGTAAPDESGGENPADRCSQPPDEEDAQHAKPGRCIDVRI